MAQRLGEFLLGKGIINQSQLQEALRTQQFFGGNLGSHLIQLGYVEEDELGQALAELQGVEYAEPALLRRPDPAALGALPSDFVRKHRALPFRLEKGELHLAMVNPRDALGIHEASFLTGLSVVPYVSPEFRVGQSIEKHYRVRLKRRKGIRVPGGTPHVQPAAPPSPVESVEPAPSTSEPEFGLDGQPMDAPADPDEAVTDIRHSAVQAPEMPPQADALPRSLREWRQSPESAAAAAGAAPEEAAERSVEAVAPPPRPAKAAATPRGSLDEAAEGIAGAASRDEVARAALRWLGNRYRRAALFSVHKDTAVGWDGMGPDFEPHRIKRVQIDLRTPSIFSSFSDRRNLYFGPVASLPVHQDLYTFLGGHLPSSVLVVPILIKKRAVAILYADNGDKPMPPPDLVAVKRLAAKIALGLEALILRNKVLMA